MFLSKIYYFHVTDVNEFNPNLTMLLIRSESSFQNNTFDKKMIFLFSFIFIKYVAQFKGPSN